MTRCSRILAALMVLAVGLYSPVQASDVTGALYRADIAVVNSSFASANNCVPFTLSTEGLITNGYIDEACTYTAMQTSAGVDIPYMPAPGDTTNWMMFIDDIEQNRTNNYVLFTGEDDMEGIIRWFPGTGGMTVADDASLELGNDFEIEIKGYFDIAGGGYFVSKNDACTVHNNASGQITTTLIAAAASTATQTTTDTTNNVFYGAFWAGQTFTATHTGQISSIGANLIKFGSPNYNIDVLLYNTSADLPTTLIGTICTFAASDITTSSVDYTFTANAGLNVTANTVYAIVMKSTGGDSSNNVRWSSNSAGGYAGGRFASSTNSGGSWTGSTHDRDFTVWVKPMVSSVATALTSGEHTLKITADGTNLKTYWDGVEKDSDALGAVTVANNANGWTFAQSYSNPYVEYVKVTVSDALVGHWAWENNETTFTDLSGEGNDATVTFRTTSTDADLTASIKTFSPISTAQLLSGSGTSPTGLVPTTLTQPVPTVDQDNWSKVPGGAVIVELLKAGDIPPALFFLPVMTFLTLLGAFVTYHFTRDMFFTGLVGNFICGMFIAMSTLYIIPLVLGLITWFTLLVKRRTISL